MVRILSGISFLLLFLQSFSQHFSSVADFSQFQQTSNANAVAKEKKYQGLLWEITGNGLKKPSYIYGTMHVSKKLAFRLSDTFYIALKNCDMIALELNPETWMEDMIKTGTYQNRTGYNSGGDFYNSFALGLPTPKMFQRILSRSHSFVNYMLYRKSASEDNFEENTFLDLFIYQAGRKQRKLITGLENYLKVQELSAKANMPVDKKIIEKEKKAKKNTYQERKKEAKITLEDAYRKGDLDAIDSMTRVNEELDNYVHFMIDERNRLMVERMDSLMKIHALFTGVGAAHLPGNMGMINMLREKGYTVRAVNPKSGRTAEKMKEKIEQINFPMDYSTQYTPDSIFSVEMPGPLYESYDEDGFSEFFYPEMANGAYYNIYRLNTYSSITGITSDSIMKILDNVLYEAIPGKIIKKSTFTQQSYPGIDITNLTRRGDYQRYKIFITPLEVVIFKMSGYESFVLTNGDRFFNSIKFNENHNQTTFAKHDFSIKMPGVKDQNFSTPFPESKSTFQVHSLHNGKYYMLMESDLHDHTYIEEDSFELDMLNFKFAEDIQYTVATKKNWQFKTFPALVSALVPSEDINKEKENGYENKLISLNPVSKIYTCLYLQGPRYFLLATTEKDSMKAMQFFQSFELKKSFSTLKTFEFIDTTLHIKLQTPVLPDDYSTYGYLQTYYRSMRDKEPYEGRTDFRSFSLPHNHQFVELEYAKLNDYRSYKDTAELWKTRMTRILGNKTMKIQKRVIGKTKNYDYMDFAFRDTASMREIQGRVIVKNNSIFTFYNLSDTLQQSNELYTTLINGFDIVEPFPGVDFLQSRGYKLFDAIKDKDSLKINEAFKNIQSITFKDEDAEKLLALIESESSYKPYLEEGSSGARNLLIENVAGLKNKKIVPTLEKLYLRAEDSSLVQLKLLSALAQQKTTEGYSTLIKLLETETPIADESMIENMFDHFYDTLKISSVILPRLLPYARYPEYKDEVYAFLATCIDSNMVKKEQYERFKNDILLDAQAEIKRVLAAEEQKKNNKLKLSDDDDDYSYSYYSSSSNSSTRSSYSAIMYAKILLPFYQESSVAKYFKRAYRSENTYIPMKIDLQKIKRNIPVPDSSIQKYLASDFDRQEFYNQLEKMKRLDIFNKKYLTQEAISRALIYEDFTDENNDSIQFVEKKKVVIKGEIGYVYYFKRYNKPQETWYIDYIGVQPLDSSLYNLKPRMTKTGIRYAKESEIKSIIKDSMEDIRIFARKRARRYNSYKF